jgi:hypothetical protein
MKDRLIPIGLKDRRSLIQGEARPSARTRERNPGSAMRNTFLALKGRRNSHIITIAHIVLVNRIGGAPFLRRPFRPLALGIGRQSQGSVPFSLRRTSLHPGLGSAGPSGRKHRGLFRSSRSIFGMALIPLPSLLADNEGVSLLERLDPTQRAAVLAALFGLVLVGLALVAFIWLGGRFVRRQNRRSPPQRPPIQSDWDRKQPGGRNERPSGPVE